LRTELPREFPSATFSFLPADMVTQILNFGLPAPIDIQIDGADIERNRQVANQILSEIRQVYGIVDPRIEQTFDYPKFDIDVDRTKAAQSGYTRRSPWSTACSPCCLLSHGTAVSGRPRTRSPCL
jgi:Cu/Ag efflux pump CusA